MREAAKYMLYSPASLFMIIVILKLVVWVSAYMGQSLSGEPHVCLDEITGCVPKF